MTEENYQREQTEDEKDEEDRQWHLLHDEPDTDLPF